VLLCLWNKRTASIFVEAAVHSPRFTHADYVVEALSCANYMCDDMEICLLDARISLSLSRAMNSFPFSGEMPRNGRSF
jgi:hypothetical protein